MFLTIIRDLSIGNREVDSGLEHSVLTGLTVDADPCRSSTTAVQNGRDNEGTGNGRESSLRTKG